MNLLIVDDEYLVVEEVVTVTDWELLGITDLKRHIEKMSNGEKFAYLGLKSILE